MKKEYMMPLMEVHNMEAEQLICFSGSSTPADSGKDILIKERVDIDDEIEQMINPFSEIDFIMK